MSKKMKVIQCNVIRAGSYWMSQCPGTLALLVWLKVSLPAVLISLPGFPTQPALSPFGWPLADLSLPQTPCSQRKGLSLILQKQLLGVKAVQHPPFQGGQECERATKVLCHLTMHLAQLCAPAEALKAYYPGKGRLFNIAYGSFKSDIHRREKSGKGIH